MCLGEKPEPIGVWQPQPPAFLCRLLARLGRRIPGYLKKPLWFYPGQKPALISPLIYCGLFILVKTKVNPLVLKTLGLLKDVIAGVVETHLFCIDLNLDFGELFTTLLNLLLPSVHVLWSDRVYKEGSEHRCHGCQDL